EQVAVGQRGGGAGHETAQVAQERVGVGRGHRFDSGGTAIPSISAAPPPEGNIFPAVSLLGRGQTSGRRWARVWCRVGLEDSTHHACARGMLRWQGARWVSKTRPTLQDKIPQKRCLTACWRRPARIGFEEKRPGHSR